MLRNSAQQTTNTAGTGTYNLSGTVISKGVLPLASVCVSGKKYRYRVEAPGSTVFEVNEGTFISGGTSTISRDRFVQSSTGSPINWPDSSEKIVSLVAIAEDFGPEGERHRYVTTAGTAVAYTATTEVPSPVLVPGMRVSVKIHATNSGAATFALNGTVAKPIKKDGVTLDPEPGELVQDDIVDLRYDAADVWQVANQRTVGPLGIRVVSTNTYAVVAGDCGKLLVFTHASGCAVALPQATAAFSSPWWVEMQNGSAASVVITPTTSTIDGALTLTMAPGSGGTIRSDSTNYRVRRDFATPAPNIWRRQTVMSSALDGVGKPSFISIGSGLSVNLEGAPVPIIMTAANGFDINGAVDRVGIQDTDTSVSAFAASSTTYLFGDIAADGTITYGKTTLAPIYQEGGAYSTVNGQFTFNVSEYVGKVGNGASASQVWRVFLGKVVTNATNVTSVVVYALNGRAIGPWTSTLPAASTQVNFEHKIGTNHIQGACGLNLECSSSDNGFAVGDRPFTLGTGPTSSLSPLIMAITSAERMQFATGASLAFALTPKIGGTSVGLTSASWKYQPYADRGW